MGLSKSPYEAAVNGGNRADERGPAAAGAATPAPNSSNLNEALTAARENFEELQVIRPEDLKTVRIGQREVLVYMPAQWSEY